MKKKIVFSLIFWQFRKFRLISTIIFLNYTQVALHWTKLDLSILFEMLKKANQLYIGTEHERMTLWFITWFVKLRL